MRFACVSVFTGWEEKSEGTVCTLSVSTSTREEVDVDSVGIMDGGGGARFCLGSY